MANTSEEMIKQMYESQLKSQKEQLTNDHNAANSQLDVQKQQNQKVTDANLTRTAVESQKAAVSDAEYYAAAGLTSGAKAQARLARENRLQSDLTAIRTAQQEADAEIERQRGLLAREFDSAIRQAQAENDLQKAQALYEEAKQQEAKLLQQQKEAASLLGAAGDFSLHGAAYGMTSDQTAALKAEFDRQAAEQAAAKAEAERQQKQKEQAAMAEILAAMGDYSGFANLYGITPEQAAAMQGKYDSEQAKQAAEEAAAKAEAERQQKQKEQAAMAEILASMGNYSGFAGLYGITPEQVAAMQKEYDDAQAKAAAEQAAAKAETAAAKEQARLEGAAKLMAQGGDFSRYGALYGLTNAEIALLNALYAAETGSGSAGGSGGSGTAQTAPLFQNSTDFSNESLTKEQIKQMQDYFGVEADGMWGNQSAAAAGGRTARQAWDFYLQELEEANAPPENHPEDTGYQPGTNAKNIIKSLETMRGMTGSEKGIANSIIAYATQGRITMDDAEYMLKYFGYDPKDYIE